VALSEDVSRIAAAAAAHKAPGQEIAAVMTVESAPGDRVYLTAFAAPDGEQEWLAFDDTGAPVTSRERVREAASIAALVEVAEEAADLVSDEPRVASLEYLDSIGGDSSIAAALPAVEELTRDVERHYKLELS
jgi:NADPH-dependent ferric siderophore reductase